MKEQYDFSNAKRGPVASQESGKTSITIRLDADILEHFNDDVQGGSVGISHAVKDYSEAACTSRLTSTLKCNFDGGRTPAASIACGTLNVSSV